MSETTEEKKVEIVTPYSVEFLVLLAEAAYGSLSNYLLKHGTAKIAMSTLDHLVLLISAKYITKHNEPYAEFITRDVSGILPQLSAGIIELGGRFPSLEDEALLRDALEMNIEPA